MTETLTMSDELRAVTCSTAEAALRAGVTVRQLNHWASRGYVRPLRANGAGHGGTRLRWEARDVTAAGRLGALSQALGLGAGPGADLLGRFAQSLAVHHGDDAAGVLVLVGDYEVELTVRGSGSLSPEVVAHGTNHEATQPATG
jgi:hypothetical protein